VVCQPPIVSIYFGICVKPGLDYSAD